MEPNKSSIGGIIGTIIIIAIIILGGLYFWGKRIEESKIKQDLVKEDSTEQEVIDDTAILNINSGDDLDSIEADLNATNLNNLGVEMNTQ